MLTGALPTVDYAPPSRKAPVDRRLDSIVNRALKAAPGERYQTAAEFLHDLERIDSSPSPHRRRLAWGAAAALVLAASGALLLRGSTSTNLERRLATTVRPFDAEKLLKSANIPESSATGILLSPRWKWTQPTDLGLPPNVNGNEYGACTSADGLTLYCHVYPALGDDGPRLWQATRPTVGEPFGALHILAETALHGAYSTDPSVSADELLLAYCSGEDREPNHADIWLASRPSPTAEWSPAGRVAASDSAGHGEWEPELATDGLTLIFHSNRSGGFGGVDLCMRRRASRDEPFGPAENLGPAVNTSAEEGGAALSSDGLTLFFHRLPGPSSLWQAFRQSTSAAFECVAPVEPASFFRGALSPSLSSDGRTLYFTLARDAAGQEIDTWICRRKP
jgi:hypothetical protein